jgi:hypothetical protein
MSLTTRVTFIFRVADALVETDVFGTLRCTDSDMLRDLSFYWNSRLPATIAFDEERGRIASVSSAPTDVIVALSPRTSFESCVTVQLRALPTVLYLGKSNSEFKFFYSVLQASLAHESQVHLAVLPGDNVIEDVRPKEPAPLSGPDFVLDKVASWTEKDAELVLRDGSIWKLDPTDRIYRVHREIIADAMQRDEEVFVSGDKSRGLVEKLLFTTRWAVEEICNTAVNGRHLVTFAPPAPVFHLRTDRPWYREALALLHTSLNSGASFGSPGVIVATDPSNSEIVAVKLIDSGKADASP